MGAFLLSFGFQIAVLTVPVAAPIFKVAPLLVEEWALKGAMGVLPFMVMQAIKLLWRAFPETDLPRPVRH